MGGLSFSRVRRKALVKALVSASSLALFAASCAAALAQNANSPPPPTAATPQPAPTPAPSPSATPEPQQQGATPAPQPAPKAPQQATGRNVLPETRVAAPVERRRPRKPPTAQVVTNQPPAPTQAQVVTTQNDKLDAARQNLLPPIGANSYQMSHQAIEALPQGTDTPLDKVLLQTPGVSQDSAASGSLHIRNEHANLQYRINGIMLPDGVGGTFGQIIDSNIIGSFALLTGALPAQYGLRTSGVLDIQTRTDAFNNSGSVSVYGGSHQTITPSFEYGGTVGQTQYFVSGRYFGSNLGIENPTPANEAIHDRTAQEKGFAYVSTVIDPNSRLTYIGGVSNSLFQIPNNPGQPGNFQAFGVSDFDSAFLNERQQEFNQFNVVAYQHSGDGIDYQLAYFNRYSQVHFLPDQLGDLVINGVASDVYRQSFINGIQEDTSWRVGYAHTLRFGFTVSGERSLVNNASSVLPVDPDTGMQAVDPVTGNPLDTPFSVFDSSSKLGWLLGTYIQDEWKITNNLTLNAGLRFDQMYQYVDANQFSPRVSLTWKPYEGTTFHAGYARTFTPPEQVIAAPTNLALVSPPAVPTNTLTPEVQSNSPVLPERAHVFDVGVVQRLIPGLDVGVDGYYKIAQDLLDDGQFGQAYVLQGFNYERGENYGIELTAKYTDGHFTAYNNFSYGRQIATNVVSNQFLFGADELAYLASHYVYTDHSQWVTGSAGASYRWDNGTRLSMDMFYGSGLRAGDANISTVPWYSQVNLGVSHEFKWFNGLKPTTVRFDVVNLFDSIYEIRDGSGIGVFAPQFGPRRGFYVGISQKL